MSERTGGAVALDDMIALVGRKLAESARFAGNLTALDRRGMSRRALALLAAAQAEAYTAELCAYTAPLRLPLPARVWAWLRVRFGGVDPRDVHRVRAATHIAAMNDAAARRGRDDKEQR